jgi:hypothetical protein
MYESVYSCVLHVRSTSSFTSSPQLTKTKSKSAKFKSPLMQFSLHHVSSSLKTNILLSTVFSRVNLYSSLGETHTVRSELNTTQHTTLHNTTQHTTHYTIQHNTTHNTIQHTTLHNTLNNTLHYTIQHNTTHDTTQHNTLHNTTHYTTHCTTQYNTAVAVTTMATKRPNLT